jgi:hypothetical protein
VVESYSAIAWDLIGSLRSSKEVYANIAWSRDSRGVFGRIKVRNMGGLEIDHGGHGSLLVPGCIVAEFDESVRCRGWGGFPTLK